MTPLACQPCHNTKLSMYLAHRQLESITTPIMVVTNTNNFVIITRTTLVNVSNQCMSACRLMHCLACRVS